MEGTPRRAAKTMAFLAGQLVCLVLIFFFAGQGGASAADEAVRQARAPATAPRAPLLSPGDSSAAFTPVSAPASEAGETKALWSISWTATVIGHKEETDSAGRWLEYDHKAVMSGYAVQRYEVDTPWKQVDWPYELVTTAEYHRVIGEKCVDGGELRSETHTEITDPYRYPSGPESMPRVRQQQREDGSWYIPDPFVGFYSCAGLDPTCGPRLYTTRRTAGYVFCDGSDNLSTRESEGIPLLFQWPGDIEGDESGTTFSKHIEWTEDDELPDTTTWDVTIRLLSDDDLTVERLEVTQGIQDGANTISLVQGRRTVVRAFVGIGSASGPVRNVTGVLRAYHGGALLGRVNPFNPNGTISAPALPDWRKIDDTLNFELPHAWTQHDGLTLEVEVNPGHTLPEENFANNIGSTAISFRACSSLGIAYKAINYAPPGGDPPSAPGANIAGGHLFLRKVYPVASGELQYVPWPAMTWSEIMHTGSEEQIGQNSTRLAERLAQDYLFGFAGSDPTTYPDRLVGWLPAQACSIYNGEANAIPGVAAWVADKQNPDYWRATFAHEVGHTYGLEHNALTTNGRHWFDVYERAIKPGAAALGGRELYDFIHTPGLPEPDRWVSAQSYEHLVNQLCTVPAPSVVATGPVGKATESTTVLLVGGIISATMPRGAVLEPLYQITEGTARIPPPGSAYCLKLKNGTILLNEYCFDADLEIEAPVPITPTAFSFGLAVPLPAGLDRVELTRGRAVLAARLPSDAPPTVTLTFPTAPGLILQQPQVVQWTANDPDGDPLTVSILYSPDGGVNWLGLGSSPPGATSYMVDFAALPGSSQALIKILASDGFYSAEDVSDNRFAVPNKPPLATIVSPPADATFNAVAPIVLEGLGTDLEDGAMENTALHWRSDRDGPLGTGGLLEVMLSPGTHTITLTATDSGRLTATDSLSLVVASPSTSGGTYHIYLPGVLRH